MYRTAARCVSLVLLVLLCMFLGFWSQHGVRAQEPSAIHLGRQEVETRIDDRHSLAVTTIRQELTNSSREAQTGSWVLPISDEAALLRFQVLSPPPKKGEQESARGHVETAGRNSYRAECWIPPRGSARLTRWKPGQPEPTWDS